MRIAVLGTGMVGRTLAAGLHGIGNEVVIGTRDPSATLSREGTDGFGTWAAAHPDVAVATFAEATDGADLVVNALNGEVSAAVIGGAGIAAGTVLLDVSNPLDSASGFPPNLFVSNTDSLAERLQRAFPDLRVVKGLHTMTAHLMTGPQALAGGDFSTFICGDDPAAKQLVTGILTQLGHTDVIDLGDLAGARGTEATMLLWLRLYQVLGTADFTFKVVR
ncbi:MAG TPA: NAD(P)-binding domain-containing protein [Propionicimonas sp.]|uniref:NADPH-dependent F420 reductase n=1 Tax=Propionicimonas sp. TaxID=1955623 RepID=UPI002F3EE7C2